jgi:lauroyl/myristoyl acyltransferase
MMSRLDGGEASDLLESLLVFSAGLHRTWSRSRILSAYASLRDLQKVYRQIDWELLRAPDPFTIEDIDGLIDTVRGFSPDRLVIAIAHCGHFIAFLCACARCGIPLAICYEGASQGYLDVTQANGIALFPLAQMANPQALFAALDEARAAGRYVALMIDGRFTSRKRYDFLGYKIAVSALPSIYAQRTRSCLLPVIPGICTARKLKFTIGGMIEPIRRNATQDLLDALQNTILRDVTQYQWSADSILLSDPAARKNALAFLKSAAHWREVHF